MKKWFILSIIANIICLPLAGIYIVRKIQFYNNVNPKPTTIQNENIFWKIRNSEFKELKIDSNSIVFLGDSHTQNFEVAEAFKDMRIKNRGIILDGTRSVLERLTYIADKHPKKIFIQIGINDLLSGVSPKTITDDFQSIIQRLTSIAPHTSIYLQSVFPTNWVKYADHKPVLHDIIELNNQLQILGSKHGCTYVDLFSPLVKNNGLNPRYDCGDSLHLNGSGYILWKNYLKRYIN
ncbi:GDSL-type esterase/lipase family protein [Mucilaginibacter kameinonensis]|uniref:GDSL-type esterase/lipase family protein n=1 Tax=Mucilaginibacter kameinonensis TaxID=452286 RepID=UPI000EF7FC6B|nr:GDSL-type esterase/lipase family protein [Mucilaginibacter kameinonensis]